MYLRFSYSCPVRRFYTMEMRLECSIWRDTVCVLRAGKYPLVYLRASRDENILVVLNPFEKDVSCPCEYQLEDVIYSLGKPVSCKEGVLYVPGESAGFIKCHSISRSQGLSW